MRAMRSDRKLELEQEFVGGFRFGVTRAPILAANLAELTRPVGQRQGLTRIDGRRIGPLRAVVAAAAKPSPRELVIAREVKAGAVLLSIELLPPTPHHFRAPDERVIDRTLQRPPPQRRVEPAKLRDEPAEVRAVDDAGGVMA